ncbi:hypothetical protein [Halobaculum sp. EA56]|uniref:hypothetical protein n=1 Tax=Halobaculum sp. EA56 TaxID=3421648 RepID=UPI003EB736E3
MTVILYKSLKVLLQLVGVAGGLYALSLGAKPTLSLILIAVMVAGPEALEILLANVEDPTRSSNRGDD